MTLPARTIPLINPDDRTGLVSRGWYEFFQSISTGLATSASYANDAAAEAGGVAVGEYYRNGSAVQIRIT